MEWNSDDGIRQERGRMETVDSNARVPTSQQVTTLSSLRALSLALCPSLLPSLAPLPAPLP